MEILDNLPSNLPNDLYWDIMKYMSHPLADLMHQVIRDSDNFPNWDKERYGEPYSAMTILSDNDYNTKEYPNEQYLRGGPHKRFRWM